MPPPKAACGASRLQGPSRRHASGSLVRPCGVSCFGAAASPGWCGCVCVRALVLVVVVVARCCWSQHVPAQHGQPRVSESLSIRALPEAVGISIRYAKHECSPTTLWALDGRRFGGLTASNRLVRVPLADGTPGAQLVKVTNLREDAPRTHSTLIPPPCARFPRVAFPVLVYVCDCSQAARRRVSVPAAGAAGAGAGAGAAAGACCW